MTSSNTIVIIFIIIFAVSLLAYIVWAFSDEIRRRVTKKKTRRVRFAPDPEVQGASDGEESRAV